MKIALVGNPNSGKSTLFNQLTGMNQKVGNFPGVTVDLMQGKMGLNGKGEASLIDLPGTYSLYPKSMDESVVFDVLCNPEHPQHPDLCLLVADASNLKRSLLLASQVIDLDLPVVLLLNMTELSEGKGVFTDPLKLETELGIPVVVINARKQSSAAQVKACIEQNRVGRVEEAFIDIKTIQPKVWKAIPDFVKGKNEYDRIQQAAGQHHFRNPNLESSKLEEVNQALKKAGFHRHRFEATETVRRFEKIDEILKNASREEAQLRPGLSARIDDVLTHKFWGFGIFFLVMLVLFQAIFAWSSLPMEAIETSFIWFSDIVRNNLPAGVFTELLVEGVLAGLSGVLVFIPQIAFLFLFIAILEETGYMARVSLIFDKILRKFGLNGRSVIPLISGVACAVPAVMSARTIQNRKERLLTILVTPLMSCSARLPVYTLLIAMVIPSKMIWGFFNVQGLVLMGLYLIGFFAAIGASWVFTKWIKSKERSYFIMELPDYKMPDWKTVGLTIYQKVRVFVVDAGKIILAISVLLWVLSSYGPKERMQAVDQAYPEVAENPDAFPEKAAIYRSAKLENSFAGILGKSIEPAIKPLGFDWKIGIALITSFAAREVFVGTMATIYSVQDPDNTGTIREKMRSEINPDTGKPRYNVAVGVSLMLFYAFAMQCMSTMAIVQRELGSWKWPVLQFVFMGAMAYLSSLIAYQVLS